MLKLKLTAAEHATLADPFKPEYKQEGDVFVLDTDVKFEDVKPLKNAFEQEKAERKKLATEKQVLEGQIADLNARAGSATDLEKAWQKKLEDAKKQHDEATKGLNGQIRELLVDNVAAQLANEISTTPSLLTPILKQRLTVEMVDGKYITRVLTPDGKASANSVKELGEEIRANKEYAPIIAASKASGGGANGNKAPVGDKPFAEMNEGERVALFKSDRSKFDRLASEHQSKAKPTAPVPSVQ
jgi:hypothetical protein